MAKRGNPNFSSPIWMAIENDRQDSIDIYEFEESNQSPEGTRWEDPYEVIYAPGELVAFN